MTEIRDPEHQVLHEDRSAMDSSAPEPVPVPHQPESNGSRARFQDQHADQPQQQQQRLVQKGNRVQQRTQRDEENDRE